MRPVVESGVQRALDQQRAKAGAIEEQVALDAGAVGQRQRGNVTAVMIKLDVGDAALDPARAVAFGHGPQEARVEARIELIGIVHPVVGQMRELGLLGGLELEAITIISSSHPALGSLEPEVLEAGGPVIGAGQAKRMEIALAGHPPIVELNAQFESGLGRAHEVGFVDVEQPVVDDQRRDGAFTHSDRANVIGFDQRQLHRRAERPRNRCCRHPAGSAATGNDDAPHWPATRLGHRDKPRRILARSWPALSGVSGASTPRADCGICAVTSSPLVNT